MRTFAVPSVAGSPLDPKLLQGPIFGYHGLTEFQRNKKETELGTLIFNAFVFMQIFNSINCRWLDNKFNMFEGIFSNKYFVAITLIGSFLLCSVLDGC
jgi:magnesium-transporting ATPase (P-type)